MYKKPRMNYSGNMDVGAWRERQIAKHIMRLLEERDELFRRRHAGDTDAELREYVIRKARAMKRMPHPMELEGGQYLNERLGDWAALARSLGYAPPGKKQGEHVYRRLWEQVEADFARERRAQRAEKQERAAQERKAKRKKEKRENGDGSRVP